jgi:hypothetical protein
MLLSKESLAALSDLIEVRMAAMCIGDQNDLREKMVLQRALSELHDGHLPDNALSHMAAIPRRGRRRKVHDLLTTDRTHATAGRH